ncbi:MAG: hypothetical protein J5486_04235 [Bacteroidaceae bacterium]|nr:hypothetical protein [Bacteroidaceae bacterium]
MATAYILDTVSQNSIVSRSLSFDVAQLAVTATCQPLRPRPPRLSLSAGLQMGRHHLAPYAGLRMRRTEIGLGYDVRLHSPTITLKYDLFQWQ